MPVSIPIPKSTVPAISTVSWELRSHYMQTSRGQQQRADIQTVSQYPSSIPQGVVNPWQQAASLPFNWLCALSGKVQMDSNTIVQTQWMPSLSHWMLKAPDALFPQINLLQMSTGLLRSRARRADSEAAVTSRVSGRGERLLHTYGRRKYFKYRPAVCEQSAPNVIFLTMEAKSGAERRCILRLRIFV